VAAKYALEAKPEAFQWAVFLKGFQGVLGAGGCEAAAIGLERRNAELIEFYQQQKGTGEYGAQRHDRYTGGLGPDGFQYLAHALMNQGVGSHFLG